MRSFLVLALIACSNSSPDCAVFEAMRQGKTPTHLTTDPAQFWADFETCYAKNLPTCERAWILSTAMPSMASPTPTELAEQRRDFLSACATLPDPVQLCLTAYAIRHEAACNPLNARDQLTAALRR